MGSRKIHVAGCLLMPGEERFFYYLQKDQNAESTESCLTFLTSSTSELVPLSILALDRMDGDLHLLIHGTKQYLSDHQARIESWRYVENSLLRSLEIILAPGPVRQLLNCRSCIDSWFLDFSFHQQRGWNVQMVRWCSMRWGFVPDDARAPLFTMCPCYSQGPDGTSGMAGHQLLRVRMWFKIFNAVTPPFKTLLFGFNISTLMI